MLSHLDSKRKMTLARLSNTQNEPNNTIRRSPVFSLILLLKSDIEFLSSEHKVSTKIFFTHHRILRKLLACTLKQDLTFK